MIVNIIENSNITETKINIECNKTDESIMISSYPKYDKKLVFSDTLELMESIRDFITKMIAHEDNYKSSLISEIQKYEKYSKLYERRNTYNTK